MTKHNKRIRKKHKGAQRPAGRRRRARVKPHKGPFQLELPLQMPLFPLLTVSSPAVSSSSSLSSSSLPAASSSAPDTPALIQPMLLDVAS